MKFKQIKFDEEFVQKYWEGPSNKFSRYTIYWDRGMGWLNQARLYFYLVGGGIFAAEFIDIFGYKIPVEWVMAGAIIGIPMIILIGRWDLQKVSKAREAVNTKDATITGFNGYNMQVVQTEILKALAIKLGVDMEKLELELDK